MNGNPITRDEIRDAIKQMKENKTAGTDEIAFEMIGTLENVGLDKLIAIANYESESEIFLMNQFSLSF